jgi:hypothetical protein
LLLRFHANPALEPSNERYPGYLPGYRKITESRGVCTMKRFTCALMSLCPLLAVLVLPSTAQAAVEVSSFRGKTAAVEFYSTDPSGCMVTDVTVFANEDRSFSPPDPREHLTSADVTVHLFNICTLEEKACGEGSLDLPAGAFHFTPLLTSATVTAGGDLHDSCTGITRSVTLAVTWTGEGELAWSRSHSITHSPGQQVWYRQSGQLRDATAVGSMTLDGAPLSLGTGIGYLTKASNGTITRFH